MSDGNVTVHTSRRVVVARPVRRVVVIDDQGREVVVQPIVRTVAPVLSPRVVHVTHGGFPGPVGPPGAEGTTARVEFDVEAGFNIAAYLVICPRMLDDSVRIASNTIGSHADRPLWLASQSALAGETLIAVSSGRVDNSGWNWAQAPIWLGADGVMTQTPPDAGDGAVFAAQLGYAISATSMFFDRFTPIFLPT